MVHLSRMPKSDKPASQKRLDANRANAARSTGPQTPEGKTRSAQNARKHGFTASKFAVVRLEELNSLANLRDDAVATYQPINSQELFAVERIALAQLALLRCAALEAGLHTDAMSETINRDGLPNNMLDEVMAGDIDVTRAQNRSLCLAIGFGRIAKKSDSWTLFLRYQAQTERLYRRAIEELERLRALRPELPNEPIPEPEIEEIELMERPVRLIDQPPDPPLPVPTPAPKPTPPPPITS